LLIILFILRNCINTQPHFQLSPVDGGQGVGKGGVGVVGVCVGVDGPDMVISGVRKNVPDISVGGVGVRGVGEGGMGVVGVGIGVVGNLVGANMSVDNTDMGWGGIDNDGVGNADVGGVNGMSVQDVDEGGVGVGVLPQASGSGRSGRRGVYSPTYYTCDG
jgi:hypothetical protein